MTQRLLLCTDLDRTLLPNGPQPESNKGFTLENTVFSGDSGNDLEVLSSPVKAILVANATAELKQTAQRQAGKSGYSAALYLARGGCLGMNGNYSAGILEGIIHYMPQAYKWFGRVV